MKTTLPVISSAVIHRDLSAEDFRGSTTVSGFGTTCAKR